MAPPLATSLRGSGRGKKTAVAGQKGRVRARQGNVRQRQGKGSGMAGRLRRPIIISFISLLKRAPLVLTKKRWGITYVTYMVVTPLTEPPRNSVTGVRLS